MIYKKIFFIVTLFLIFNLSVKSQWLEVPIQYNSTIANRYKAKPWTIKSNDTLDLPFLDDFAKTHIYPDSTLWENNYVFVNQTFAINPPSVGVATFDMLDNKGRIYENATPSGFYADTLTSKPINLFYPGDTTIYFSFWIQPQGVSANKPETEDSLILQFYSPIVQQWKNIWASPGYEVSDFKLVLLPIRDSIYLQKGFQFRFINRASIGGNSIPSWASNGDYWNIDMVYLDRNRSENDTIINDIAIKTPLQSPIDYYQAIPWSHYDSSIFLLNYTTNTYKLPQITFCNLGRDSANIGRYIKEKDLRTGNTIISVQDLGSDNIDSFACFNFTPFYQGEPFPDNNEDSAEFEFTFYIKYDTTGGLRQLYRWNDTITRVQRFYDYYAYDDGTAESGAGLYGVGTSHAYLAYKFHSYKGDTLRAVKIFFNRTKNNANRKYFILTVWSDNNGQPGNIIYQKLGYRPEFADSLNYFHTYLLDTSIYINGTFYIGWERTTEDFLNVGFDKNNNVASKIFFNIDGTWENTPLSGALMIRPIFSMNPYTQTSTPQSISDIQIYPNPAKDNFYIQTQHNTILNLYNMTGKLLINKQISKGTHIIYTHTLKQGLYILKLQDDRGNIQTKKLIIR